MWNEEDLKAMKAYEEAIKVLAIERERYRKILEEKWTKTMAAVKVSWISIFIYLFNAIGRL